MNRRSFVQILGLSPLVKRQAQALVEKHALDSASAKQVGVSIEGIGGLVGPPPATGHGLSLEKYRLALLLARPEIESTLFQGEYKFVHYLDPDLAVKRSFSLSAKIAFQRQRNVNRRLEHMQAWGDVPSYLRLDNLLRRVLEIKTTNS